MNLLNKLRYVPKRFGVVAAIVAATVIPAALFAWGPTRTTYTIENPAPHVTFNSITNNPEYGDERSFLTVRDLTTGQTLGGSTTVVPGHEYLFQIYVHNNAATNLNSEANGYKGIARGTTLEAALPTEVNGSADAAAYVRASNAQPGEVYDTVKLSSTGKVLLDYQEGTARLFTNHFTSGTALNDSLITGSGVQVGYNALDGNWPGCLQYSGTVTFRVKAHGPANPNFTIKKEVRKAGDATFVESVDAKPGDKVNYRMTFTNTGQTQLDNVILKDTLPKGVSFVPGTVKILNANNPGGAFIQNGDQLVAGGVNIGHYTAGSNALVIFDATVDSNDKLPVCGPNLIHNVASAQPEGQNPQEDGADVKVPKECIAEAKYSCDALTVAKISRTQFTFTATRTVENAEYVRTVFIVRGANGTEVARVNDADGVYTYTRSQVGTYSVEAQIVVRVNGVEKVATSANCKKNFEVKEEPVTPVYECTSLELIKKSRDTFEFKTTARAEGNVTIKEVSVDFGDGQKQVVDYGKNATHTYAAPGEYTAVATVSFTVDGKTVTKTSSACKVKVTIEKTPDVECKPGIPMGDERCEETPEVPEVLPSTGPEAFIGGLFGSSALGLGITSFVRSRRALRNALNS